MVVDESGSMQGLLRSTIEGFNEFLAKQKELPGLATITLCKFSSEPSVVYSSKDIKEVSPLSVETYRPNGNTALLDALGQSITELGKHLASLKEEDRPGKVMFVVVTDGHENASTRYTQAKIKSMIEHQEKVYNWNFVYLGANVDAAKEAVLLGMNTNNSVNYAASSRGVKMAYGALNRSISSYRASDQASVELFKGVKKC